MVDREKNFLLSGAEGYGHGHFSGGSSLRALLDLGQVCRSWREVVYATPLLWSHIHFSKLESKEGDAARHQESMNFMLTRSKRHSLSVTVSLGAHNHVYDGYYGEEHVSPFIGNSIHPRFSTVEAQASDHGHAYLLADSDVASEANRYA